MWQSEFTGRKMLIVTVSAFAVIIGVNILLAVKAVETFPGLETKNSYVASQNFNAERAAQEALGWTVRADVVGGRLIVAITDRSGQPVKVRKIGGTLGRATTTRDDRSPEFVFNGREYVAPADLGPGNWNFRMKAVARDGTAFHQRLVIHLKR